MGYEHAKIYQPRQLQGPTLRKLLILAWPFCAINVPHYADNLVGILSVPKRMLNGIFEADGQGNSV